VAESSLRDYVANTVGQFNAGVIDNTLGLADLGAQGLAYLYNKATGSNAQPYNLSGMVKDELGVQSDPSSMSYAAGSIAPAVVTGVSSALRQLPNVMGRESLSYAGGELGGQVGQEYFGDTGGLVGSIAGSMAAPQGAVRSDIFAGPNSRTADLKAMEAAQELSERGMSPAEIKAQTGWEKNLDGNWMYEIPDAGATLNRRQILNDLRAAGTYPATSEQGLTGIVSDYFDNPALFEAYPALANRPLTAYADPSSSTGGYVLPKTGEIGINVGIRDSRDKDRPLGSMIHELQHAVSGIEGRSGGGSPASVRNLMEQSENRDLAPYMDDWIEYNNIRGDINLIGSTKNFRQLQDIASSPDPDFKDLRNTYQYRNMSGIVHNTFGDPSKDNLQEWTRNAAQFLLDNSMDSVTDSQKKRRIQYLLSLPEEGFEQELKDAKDIADKSRAGYQSFEDTRTKYYQLRQLPEFEQYQAINDETLAREATARMNMTAPSALRELYTSRVENPDRLWNAIRRYSPEENVVKDIYDMDEDEYIQAINPQGTRIAPEARPNLGMGDMYGMAPRNASEVMTQELPSGEVVRYVQDDDAVYALGYNPDLGEEDVVGYMLGGGDSSELAVVNQMQGQGIGGNLSYLYRSQNPMAQSGGLTEAGEGAARKTYRRIMGYE
jgi:hypothetical protein